MYVVFLCHSEKMIEHEFTTIHQAECAGYTSGECFVVYVLQRDTGRLRAVHPGVFYN